MDIIATPSGALAERPFGRLFAVAVVALALCACATTPAPVDQIHYFSRAFTAVNTVGQPLLDDLAVAERAQGQQVAARRAQGQGAQVPAECGKDKIAWQVAADKTGIIRGYCLADSGYFSDIGDPPATARLRGGLLVIESYADLLSSLADGRNDQAALGQIDALGQQVGGLLATVGIAAGPIAPALAALQPILQAAAHQADAAEARRLILQGAPVATQLIAALRASAPAMFDVLIESAALKMVLQDQPAAIADQAAKVEAYRVAVANYVVLLGKLQDAWDRTVAAVNAPESPTQLASVVAMTSQVAADAETARRVFAVLRSGGAAAAKP